MRTSIILILLFVSLSSKAQTRTFTINNKTYTCTESYQLRKPGSTGCNDWGVPIILFAKDGVKGMIAVKKYKKKITGALILYLDDNTIINCLDRKVYDKLNDEYTTVFYLTEAEVKKLKTVNIKSIRYNILDEDNGREEAYSMDNKDYECGNPIKKYNRYDFPKIITELFK